MNPPVTCTPHNKHVGFSTEKGLWFTTGIVIKDFKFKTWRAFLTFR